jgi:hypothetical protein
MADGFDFSSLPSTLTDYVHENNVDLVYEVMYGMDSSDHMQVIETNGKTPLVSFDGEDILQPSANDGAWNAKKLGTFKNRFLDPKAAKVDIEFVPAEAFKNYLNRQSRTGRKNQPVMTFEQWLIETYLPERIAYLLERNTIWSGVYNGSGTTSTAIADGFLKHILTAIGDDSIPAANIIECGTSNEAVTATNVLTHFQDLVDGIPDEYKMVPLKLFCSPTVARWYERKYQTTHGSLPYNTQFQKTFVDGTQVEIVPRAGMQSSTRLILTPETNFFLGFDRVDDLAALTFETSKRKLLVMADFAFGCNFADPTQVFVNDLDTDGTES